MGMGVSDSLPFLCTPFFMITNRVHEFFPSSPFWHCANPGTWFFDLVSVRSLPGIVMRFTLALSLHDCQRSVRLVHHMKRSESLSLDSGHSGSIFGLLVLVLVGFARRLGLCLSRLWWPDHTSQMQTSRARVASTCSGRQLPKDSKTVVQILNHDELSITPVTFHKATALALVINHIPHTVDHFLNTSDKTRTVIHQMKSSITVLLAVFAVAASAVLTNNVTDFVDPATNLTIKHFNCGVSRASASQHFNETLRFLSRGTRHSGISLPHEIGTRAPAVIKRQKISPALVVNTYIHLLTTTAKAGTLTKKHASAQVATLNRAYKPIGVTFRLINVSITANDAWAVSEGADMDAAKQSLRRGNYADLNLYFHSDLTGGILGTCTLPSQVNADTTRSQYTSDGCNINANTMPGGAMTGYNKGMTAVHETGHWLGLLHTFEGYSCTGDGDGIADTPMQSTSTDGCPSSPAKDSCPDADGFDVSHVQPLIGYAKDSLTSTIGHP